MKSFGKCTVCLVLNLTTYFLIRLPEVNFPQNETLRMYVGCIQP